MANPKIFRQYDIRGVWGEDLTEDVVEAIAKAFSVYIKRQIPKDKIRLSIGRDVRLSSPAVLSALARGFNSSGIDVIDIGVCPTPLQYFSLYSLDVDGGVMITGSHNPAEFNGLKLSVGHETIFGDTIQEVRKIVESGETITGTGKLDRHDIIPDYIDYVSPRINRLDGIKVVIDSGNGTGGIVAPDLMRKLGAEVIEIYCEPDGRFPNHHPDPVVLENLKDLIAKVKETGAHLGVGYDGDSDRLGVVDEHGEVIWGDRLMIIFGREILKEKPGATIIGEVKCSKTLYDDIKAKGGVPIMWKTGHSLIKKKMRETGAMLAGEMSGHLFFADRYFGYDDAVYASLRLMEILVKRGKPFSVSALLKDVPRMVSTPEIRFDCPDDVKFKLVEKVKAAFKGYEVVDIDGVRVTVGTGWGLIRASNTQPALVMRFEAENETELKKVRDFVEGELKKLL